MRSLTNWGKVSLNTFKKDVFQPERPAVLRRLYKSTGDTDFTMPAIGKWFARHHASEEGTLASLNSEYFGQFANVLVPLEVTTFDNNAAISFERVERPLEDFLAFIRARANPSNSENVFRINLYLAQCSIASLPFNLQRDLPLPALCGVGRGDIYDSSIWLGLAPTFTPLHKDPNPNLFVQMAGQKQVRIFEPRLGLAMFAEARRMVGSSASSSIRGDEMMHGEERNVLDDLVWHTDTHPEGYDSFEAHVESGDAIFIPKGWWHSLKSVGSGINGSVCLLLHFNTSICLSILRQIGGFDDYRLLFFDVLAFACLLSISAHSSETFALQAANSAIVLIQRVPQIPSLQCLLNLSKTRQSKLG